MNLRRLMFLLCLCSCFSGFSFELAGNWGGVMKNAQFKLPLLFQFSSSGQDYMGWMDSPLQNAKGMPLDQVRRVGDSLYVKIDKIRFNFEGKYDQKTKAIAGNILQHGQKVPFTLTPLEAKHQMDAVNLKKYVSKEISIPTTDSNVAISGTLTTPHGAKEYPLVILINGSGAQNRDSELMGHKPFLVLSDYLTQQGYGVFRYDDRGVGKSTGSLKDMTTQDLAEDVAQIVKWFRTQPQVGKLGLLGHSEGASIAFLVAAEDKKIDFIVSMAGPGIRGDKILLSQTEYHLRSLNLSEDVIQAQMGINEAIYEELQTSSYEEISKDVPAFVHKLVLSIGFVESQPEYAMVKKQLSTLLNPWMHALICYDPCVALAKVACPVLAVNGAKDRQVSLENLTQIELCLEQGGNQQVKAKEYMGLNHLMQTADVGSVDEYAFLSETISPVLLKDILSWLNTIVK